MAFFLRLLFVCGAVLGSGAVAKGDESSGGVAFDQTRWGASLGWFDSTTSLSVSQANVSFKSVQSSFQFSLDRPLLQTWRFRGLGGFDAVESSSQIANPPGCQGQETCSLQLRFFSFSVLAGQNILSFQKNQTALALLGGVVGLYPLSKKSDALDTQSLGLSLGLTAQILLESFVASDFSIWSSYGWEFFAPQNSVRFRSQRGLIGITHAF